MKLAKIANLCEWRTKMTLGEKLLDLRQNRGWTQDIVSKKVEVSRSTYNHWEREIAIPSLELLKKLATVFGVSLDELCSFTLDTSNRIDDYDSAMAKLNIMGVDTTKNGDVVNLGIYGSVYDVNLKDLPTLVKRANIQYQKMLSRVNQGLYNAALLLTLNSGDFTFRFNNRTLESIPNRVYFWLEQNQKGLTPSGLVELVKEDFLFLPSSERLKAWNQILDELVNWNIITLEDCDKEEWQCPFLSIKE